MPDVIWRDLPDQTLRDKIINTLGRIGAAIANAISAPLRDGVRNLHDWVSERWTEETDRVFAPTLREMRTLPGTTPEMLAFIDRLLERRSPAWWMILLSLIGTVGMYVGTQWISGPMRLVSMTAQRRFRPARSSTRDLTDARLQGWIGPGDYLSDMAEMGFSDERAEWLLWIAHRWPAVAQVYELLNRQEIDGTQAVQFLRRQGFNAPTAETLLSLRMEIPNIQDLIRFAVREAYTPSAIEELGLHQEFPQEIMPDATKRGLSQKYALDYWAAHWQLPSVSQVFEMLHRRVKDAKGNVFDQAAMARFLKYADYAGPWRQMLIDISYNPYTRREMPRLFRLGVIDEEEMYSGYLDVGLSPEKARKLVDASIREAREASRDLTRADIEAGYKRRLISPEAASAALAALGYDGDEVAYILARNDYDKAQARVSSRKATIKRRYISGLIDHELAIRQLSEAGVEAEEIPDLIAEWTEDRESKVERPTVDQLDQMYRRRIISGPDLAAELAGHGYNDRYIQLMMANIEAEIAEENAKRTEAERRRQAITVKLPTKADLLDWREAGIITTEDMRQRMRDQGYLDEDIDRYLRQQGIVVTIPAYRTEEGRVRVATLKLQVREGLISLGEFVSGLLTLEVPPSLADALAEYEEVKLGPATA